MSWLKAASSISPICSTVGRSLTHTKPVTLISLTPVTNRTSWLPISRLRNPRPIPSIRNVLFGRSVPVHVWLGLNISALTATAILPLSSIAKSTWSPANGSEICTKQTQHRLSNLPQAICKMVYSRKNCVTHSANWALKSTLWVTRNFSIICGQKIVHYTQNGKNSSHSFEIFLCYSKIPDIRMKKFLREPGSFTMTPFALTLS